MHRTLGVFLALASVHLSWAGEPSRENYLPNPGFEEGLKDWHPWKTQDATITTDSSVSHSGKSSLRLEYKDLDRRKETYLFAYSMLSDCFTPGRTYTASGWVKIGNVPPSKKGPVACLQDGSGLGESPRVPGPTNSTKDGGWVFVSFKFKATEKNRGLGLRCLCDVPANCVAGTVWFDDLKVEEGDQPTAFRPDWIPATDFYTRGPFIYFPMPPDYRCSTEVATPHVELARPSAGGPLRLLWAGHWFSGRQACELAQRGDFQLDTVVFNGSNAAPAYFQRIHEDCIAVFRQRLRAEPSSDRQRAMPQVLVIEQGSLESFAKPERDVILARVKKGMGCIILLGPTYSEKLPGEQFLTRKVKELLDGAGQMTESGHGSVVTVLNPSADDRNWQSTFGIEWAHGEVLRAISRCLGRPLADVRMTVTPAKAQAGDAVKVTVASAGSAVRVRLFPNLPVPGGGTYGQGRGMGVPREPIATLSANLEKGSATVSLPELAAGEYFLVAQTLDTEKHVLGWSLSRLTVGSPISIAKLDAGEAAFTDKGRPLSVSCTIKNAAAPRVVSLVAQVYDPLGRLLALSAPVPITLKQGETNARISVALTHAELCSAQVVVQVRSKDQVLASSSVWTSTELLMTRIDFNAGPYDDFYLGARHYGADLAVDRRPELGLRPFDWIDIFAFGSTRDLETKSVCDPAVLEGAKQLILTRSIKGHAPLHPIACLLHDELDAFGFRSNLDDHNLAFFRQYLKETYRTLPALNASWGTHYHDWQEIDARPAARFLPHVAMNPAPWADWNRASELAAHQFYAALDVAARQADPGFRIGVSGTRNTSGTNGIDWWLLTRDLRSVALYDGISGEIFRSFALPEALVTRWSHLGTAPSDFVRWRIWTDVCRHREGTPTYGGRVTNLFYPDYRRNPAGVAFFDELAEIRKGFGRLILSTPLDDRSVAIFYSPACHRAQIVHSRNWSGGEALNDSLDSLFSALSDAGIKPHFVSYEQVSCGELKPETTKVLCLWGALALTETEASAIRQYAKDGGVVLADSEPGLYDEHCHRLAQARLKDLFEDARPVHLVGKGKAIFFGSTDPSQKRTGNTVGGEFSARLAAVLDKEAGVRAAFTLRDEQNRNAFKKMEGYTYMDGAARYVSLVPEVKYGETEMARLTIQGKGQFYDCRAGKYFGAAGTQEVVLHRATANLFALLPYKVEKVAVTAPSKAVLGQPISVKAVLQTGPGVPIRHVLVVQLRRPDGQDLPVHRWIFDTQNRSLETTLFLALNDPVGKWTLVVTDVATGVRHEQPMEILGLGGASQGARPQRVPSTRVSSLRVNGAGRTGCALSSHRGNTSATGSSTISSLRTRCRRAFLRRNSRGNALRMPAPAWFTRRR